MEGKLTATSVIITLIIIVIVLIIAGFIIKLAWNYTIPKIFPGVNEINIPQAIVLAILADLLFGGFSRVYSMKGCDYACKMTDNM